MNLFRKTIDAILTFLTYAAPGTTALVLTLVSFGVAVGVWAIAFNVYHEYGFERLLPLPDYIWEPQSIGVLWGVMMVIGFWFLFDRRGKTVRSSVGEDSVRFRVGEDRVHSLDIPQAKKRVWLLGLSLLPFATERYIGQLKEAMIKRGVEVHILLLDPDSEVALSRHKQLYEGDRTLPDDIRGALQSFKELGTR